MLHYDCNYWEINISLLEQRIVSLFVIYCASFNGRLNSRIVTKVLIDFKQYTASIAYGITNMYAADDNQLNSQCRGGFNVMNDVFLVKSRKVSEYY